MKYEVCSERLYNKLKTGGIRPGLACMEQLLACLGHPEESCLVVHVAGTNGKGSVMAFLSSILTEAGFKVGRYNSPAVLSHEEQYRIGESSISSEQLAAYYSRIEQAVDQLEAQGEDIPTLFEAQTAIAFLYFMEEKVDYALIETGMGGLLDATNVVKKPALTIITPIGYDHMGFLGNTLIEIAGQKAGIIKPQVPVILSENSREACEVIGRRAKELASPLIRMNPQDYSVCSEDTDGSRFFFQGEMYTISLPGRHQITNAVTALAGAKVLLMEADCDPLHPKKLPEKTRAVLREGLSKAVWPGRLSIIGRDPLVLLDGAHNLPGARMLAQFLEKHFSNRRILYIIGVLKDKEYEKMLKVMLPLASMTFVFRPDNERGLDAEVLAGCIRALGKKVEALSGVKEALAAARKEAGADDVLVIWGSLSFIGDLYEDGK